MRWPPWSGGLSVIALFGLSKKISQKSGFLSAQQRKCPFHRGFALLLSVRPPSCTDTKIATCAYFIGVFTVARIESLVFTKVLFRHEVPSPSLFEPHALVSFRMHPLV